jgi:hypothetical protein
MVFDVVMSRQRKYGRVRQFVAEFDQRSCSRSLAELADDGPGGGMSMRAKEPATIQQVAEGLARYCYERGLDEDQGVLRWAEEVEPVRLAPRLDPYVGSASGIGAALFAYCRMRSGADAIKPDVRVRSRLNQLGFEVPGGDDVALLLIAETAAEDLGVHRLELDQALW